MELQVASSRCVHNRPSSIPQSDTWPTCGLQISFRRIAEVLDSRGNPLCLYSIKILASLFLIVALCLHSAQFVRHANTVITPPRDIQRDLFPWFRFRPVRGEISCESSRQVLHADGQRADHYRHEHILHGYDLPIMAQRCRSRKATVGSNVEGHGEPRREAYSPAKRGMRTASKQFQSRSISIHDVNLIVLFSEVH